MTVHVTTTLGHRFRALGMLPLAGCLLTGWTFNTIDYRRPLVPDPLPREAEEVASLVSGASEEAVSQGEDSLEWTRKATKYFSVHTYHDFAAPLGLSRLFEAIRAAPDNAFAWVQLGADLMLLQEVRPAIAATERALQILDPLTREHEIARRLQEVALINLASFQEMDERPGDALMTLRRLDHPEELDPFRRLAFRWVAARIYLSLEEPEAAAEELHAAREIGMEELASVARELEFSSSTGYPQYFSADTREATQLYFEGRLAHLRGEAETAEKAFAEALAKDSRLLEVRFTQAALAVRDEKLQLAESRFSTLLADAEAHPKKFFRRERIYFNWGNAFLLRGKNLHAVGWYATALELASERRSSFEAKYRKAVRFADGAGAAGEMIEPFLSREPIDRRACLDLADMIAKAPQLYGFPEAHLNRGVAYLREASKDSRALDRAALSLCRAAKDPDYRGPHVALARLGEVFAAQERWAAATNAFVESVEIAPGYEPAIEGLFRTGASASEPSVRAEAYGRGLGALERLGPSAVLSDYADELGAASAAIESDLRDADRGLAARAKRLLVRANPDT